MNRFRYSLCLVVAIILTLSSIASAEEQAIEKGITWLTNTQTKEGYWGEEEEVQYNSFVDTCTVVTTLKYLEKTGTIYTTAINWIDSIEVKNIDYLSQKIEALIRAGRDVTSLLNSLVKSVNSDGGWSASEDFKVSDIKRTALALRALSAAEYSDTKLIENTVFYLLSQQNGDGGWGLGAASSGQMAEGSVYLTSLVLLVLDNYKDQYNLHSRLYDGVLWFANQQNADGGFGREGSGQGAESSVWETALAYQALIRGQKAEGSGQRLRTLYS